MRCCILTASRFATLRGWDALSVELNDGWRARDEEVEGVLGECPDRRGHRREQAVAGASGIRERLVRQYEVDVRELRQPVWNGW